MPSISTIPLLDALKLVSFARSAQLYVCFPVATLNSASKFASGGLTTEQAYFNATLPPKPATKFKDFGLESSENVPASGLTAFTANDRAPDPTLSNTTEFAVTCWLEVSASVTTTSGFVPAGKPVTVTVNLPPRPVKANAVAGVGLTTLPAVSLMLEETPNVYFVFLVCEAVVKVTVWPSLETLAAVTPKAGVIVNLLAVPAPTMVSLNTTFTLELLVDVTLMTVGRVVSPVVGGVQALRMNTKLRTAIRLVNIRAGFIGTTSKKR